MLTDELAERRARHLSVCQELIDYGMRLARRAAQEALDAPEPTAPPNPKQPNPKQKPGRLSPGTRDPALIFARLAAEVRLAVALEAKIAAGACYRPPAYREPSAPRAAPRPKGLAPQVVEALVNQNILSEAVHIIAETDTHPDRWKRHQAIEQNIEETLATHPEDPLPTHFARICRALNLEPNLAALSDYLAEDLTPQPPPDG